MSRESVPAALQRRVRERAANRCEYCRLSQAGQEATFHVDHVQPRQEGGLTTLENLALACVSCSLRKGARTHGEDPLTGAHGSCSTLDGFAGRITSRSQASS
ncbi:HNH endonuclease [Sorangium sp. So ce1097]|uniref:HNH endonuclease n=1 Tax=Sorangium sp. So ce1097 TaxID=3133330 RepID=UPI003F62A287